MRIFLIVFMVLLTVVGCSKDPNRSEQKESMVLSEEDRHIPSEMNDAGNLTLSTDTTCSWVYDPKEDMTVHELGLILPVFIFREYAFQTLEGLPERAKRHFRKEGCE